MGWLMKSTHCPRHTTLLLAMATSVMTIASARVPAQTPTQPAAPTAGTTVTASPDTPPAHVTVRDVVTAMDSAARLIHLTTTDAQANADLAADLTILRNSPAIDWDVNDLAAGLRRPGIMATGKGRKDVYNESLQLTIVRAMREARQITYQIIQPQLLTDAGTERAHAVLAPVRALHDAILEQSKADDLERLRRFGIKYGPGSPHLNVIETLANYALQSFSPFGIEADRSPGPFEVVASYATHDFTVANSKLAIGSLGTIGLRRYIFTQGWGTSVLRPSYIDAGVAIAGERDGVLVNPWQGHSRVGGFFSWGDYRVAWVGGGRRRVFVSRNLQLVHWVF